MLGVSLSEHLESEARFVIQRAFSLGSRVAVLFSGGKDSSVLLQLVERLARLHNLNYTILHIDTGKNFPEVLSYRDAVTASLGRPFLVEPVEADNPLGLNRAQSFALNRLIKRHQFDCVLGGGRRDEDPARSKETFFSLRGEDGGWNPEESAVEIWPWLGMGRRSDQHFRVFPISNWNESDVWKYIENQKIEVCPLYFSHTRKVWSQGDQLHLSGEAAEGLTKKVRFRTIGDQTNSTPLESDAQSIKQILQENNKIDTPERHGRQDDQFSRFAMEIRKKEGYF